MAWTEADFERVPGTNTYRRIVAPVAARVFPVPAPSPMPHDRYRSKTERRYAQMFLDIALASGQLKAWWYEPLKLRLAATCFYTPDFLLQYADEHLQLHEVKGFWRDDARVKIKVAAALYPCFTFRAVRWVKGFWRYEDF